MMRTQFEIGVIGAGNAAEGIVDGLLRKMVLMDDRVIASDPSDVRRELFKNRFRIETTDDNRYVASNSYILVLAVKPQVYKQVVGEFADLVTENHLIVSIMAGVSTASIEALFPNIKARVVRVMPNLAMRVGAGVAGVHCGRHATEADRLHGQRIFDAAGFSIVIEDEAMMDAVTAVSGSGPAYFYYFVEAIVEAGKAAGLPAHQAHILAVHTCYGAAKMMLESGDVPSVLREKVTSPGGTTQAALDQMKRDGVFEKIEAAVLAAFKRSRELGQ